MANSISGSAGLAGALVICSPISSGATAASTATADGSGNYTFASQAAGKYVILCQSAGYTFSPNGSVQTIVSSNITGVNFTATAVTAQAVWTKRAAPVIGGAQFATEPSVMREGNAQILSGTVFKMWYLGGGYTTGGIYYAESTDGITWSQYSGNPVIAGYYGGRVFKNGSTYYGYYVKVPNWTQIDQFTSSDGISWTNAHASVLTTGAAGTWDSGQIYNMQVVEIDSGGTWWAVYGGNLGFPVSGVQATGLASSPDGVTWTKYASNPIMWNVTSTNVVKISGNYVAWGDTTVYGAGGTYPFGFPTNLARSQATSLAGPWSIPIPSMKVSQYWESVGGGNYQIDSPWVLQVGTKTYMWYGASPTSDNGTNFQIGLATANATPTQLASLAAEGNVGAAISATPVQFIDNLLFASAGPLTITMTFPGSVTSGNLLLAWCGEFLTGHYPAQCTDSRGNTWFTLSLVQGNPSIRLCYAVAKDTGACTVTFAQQGGSNMSYPGGSAAEFSGVLLSGVSYTNSASAASGNPLTAAVSAVANSLVVGAFIVGSSTVNVNTGWTTWDALTAQFSNAVFAIESVAGSYSPSMQQSANNGWAAAVASFQGNAMTKPVYGSSGSLALLGVGG